jgi:hypothetical protein
MERIVVNVKAGDARLVYLIQDEMCIWGKGMSFISAMENYKKVAGKRKPVKQTLSVYLCLKPLTEEEAFAEIRFDWVTQVYSTENIVLLQNTTIMSK